MNPSWDLFIILFFVIMGVYGFLLGRGRVFNILINTYVGLVVATQLGSYAYEYLSRITEVSHSFDISMFGAKLFVFASVIFVLTLNKELAGTNDDSLSSPIYTVIYGVLSAGLILSSVFSFMTDPERTALFASSNLAGMVYAYSLLWIVAPIVAVLGINILTRLRK